MLFRSHPKKDVLFIIGDWNAKVGSQETPGVTGKFGLGIQNEAGQRLTEFCQEKPLASLLFSAICKASSDDHLAFLRFIFLGMVLIPLSCTAS